MSRPAPTRVDHKRFCEREGWDRVEDARGRHGTHHFADELNLPDGRNLRTRISHPIDRTAYGHGLWAYILREQLEVTEQEFWACVRQGVRPDRGYAVTPAKPLPARLAYMLIHDVGLGEQEVAAMTKDEAIDRLQKHWSGED